MRTIKTPEVGTQALNVIEDILRKLVTELYNLTGKVWSSSKTLRSNGSKSPTIEERIAGSQGKYRDLTGLMRNTLLGVNSRMTRKKRRKLQRRRRQSKHLCLLVD